MEFNKTDLKFKSGTNKCAEKTKCNADIDGSNKTMAYVCYDDHLTGCNDTTPCTTPEGDNGAATCGYIKVGNATANLTSGGMCIDDGDCNKDNATAGKSITYFGQTALLICGSVKTGLALGAAAASAYLAM